MHQKDRRIPRQQVTQQFAPAGNNGFAPLAAVAGEQPRPTDVPDRQGAIAPTDILTLASGQNSVHVLAERHSQAVERFGGSAAAGMDLARLWSF